MSVDPTARNVSGEHVYVGRGDRLCAGRARCERGTKYGGGDLQGDSVFCKFTVEVSSLSDSCLMVTCDDATV